ncbi:DUF6383 domain-containing protein [Parabacteroides sp.]
MNKKFSTLVAGAALLMGAVSVNAQFTHVALQGSTVVDKLQTKNGAYADNGLYQLSNNDAAATTADSVLYMTTEGKLLMVPAPLSSDSLANTLWCVSVADPALQGSTYKWNFVNKGTGQRLDITMGDGIMAAPGSVALVNTSDSVKVGGDIAGWAFAGNYKETLSQNNYLYSYFSTDSVVGLAVREAGSASEAGGVFLVKEAASKAMDKTNKEFKPFTLRKAAEIILSAKEINTIFGTYEKEDHGVKLNFDRDINKTNLENPFNTKSFVTEQVTTRSAAASSDTLKYVYVMRSDSSYLKVDTAYTNNDESNAKFLAYKWSKLDKTNRKYAVNGTPQDSLNKSELKAQYQFLFTYRPSVDSLNIYVNQATFHTAGKAAMAKDFASDTTHFANARVSLQTLVSGDDTPRILTIDSLNQNTHISFGWGGCTPVASDKKSADNGLYVIYNAKGQVLASPIHKNGTAYEWVTLDSQEPKHMPAYQWFVEKTQNSESLKGTSPLKLTNREFGITVNPVQLREKDGKIVADAFSVGTLTVDAGTAVDFQQIKDSTILKDKYLGYKKFDADSLTIAQYKFNYLHKFEKNSWITRGNAKDKDSVLYAIKDDYTAFTIVERNKDNSYGPSVPAGDAFKGIAALVRTQYMMAIKADTVGIGAEDRIVLGKAQHDSVYFKENNEYDSNHYYAIVKAVKSSNKIDTIKFSVSDAGVSAYMQAQPLANATTSAFAIKVDDVPLYRRFNTSLENAVAGQEDSTKILKFKEYYRGEYLMDENNPKFQNADVDYLGIERADKATGLSFYVDTAILNSTKAGYIKPQYFIYLNPEIQPAVPATPCPLDHNHGVDADGNPLDAYHCSHAEAGKPGYMKAQYLVSFADSVSRPAADADKLYKFGEYTRVGFVDGLRMGDSLYILTNGFEKLALADLDTAKIKAAYKAAKIEFNIIDLKAERTDAHHNYTWSFRFVDPEKAANLREEDRRFLIESAKKTGDKDIAPEYGAWLKSQNGCLVLSDKATSEFDNTKTGGDNALIFNIENGSKDDLATDNEAIATSEVAVIAQEGAVRIANAEGKKVVITNILGQTVANTVITSSDAVIAAPQGVVVVAVEGEEAVKAIVK